LARWRVVDDFPPSERRGRVRQHGTVGRPPCRNKSKSPAGVDRDDARAQPRLEVGEVESPGLEHPHQFCVDVAGRAANPLAVDPQEDIHHGNGDSLVAVDEGMVDAEALEQRRPLRDESA